MSVYVVLLFDQEDAVVVSADTIEAQDVQDVEAQAQKLVRATRGANGYEVWLNGTKVASSLPDGQVRRTMN